LRPEVARTPPILRYCIEIRKARIADSATGLCVLVDCGLDMEAQENEFVVVAG
jgi:hypothetical protein